MQLVKIDKEYFVSQLYASIYLLQPDQKEVKEQLLDLVSMIQNAPSEESKFPRINGRRTA